MHGWIVGLSVGWIAAGLLFWTLFVKAGLRMVIQRPGGVDQPDLAEPPLQLPVLAISTTEEESSEYAIMN